MSFGTLVVIALAGLCGPLVPVLARRFVPSMLGEILGGILVGPAVLGVVHPSQPTISFLAEVGFAMLMFTVGLHLPLRESRLVSSVRGGAVLAGIVCALSVPAALLAANLTGTGHAAIYAVVLASGSAAVLLPAIREGRLEGRGVLVVAVQVTALDVLTIVSVPIVLQPSRAGRAALWALIILCAAALALAAVLAIERSRLRGPVRRVRALSKRREWALDLRVSLVVLFALAWLAQRGGTSVLIAGFAAGVMVAALGGPKRLSTQVRGIGEGFFVPLYFVVLGARLDLSGLGRHPSMLALAVTLVLLNVLIRLSATALTGRSPSLAFAATAQLGVPAAVASLGLAKHLISPELATAVVCSALLSLLLCTLGVGRLALDQGDGHGQAPVRPPAPPPQPESLVPGQGPSS